MAALEDNKDSDSLIPTDFDKNKLESLSIGESWEGELGNWKVMRYKGCFCLMVYRKDWIYEFDELEPLIKALTFNSFKKCKKIKADPPDENDVKEGVIYNKGCKMEFSTKSKEVKIYTKKDISEEQIKKMLDYFFDEGFFEPNQEINAKIIVG